METGVDYDLDRCTLLKTGVAEEDFVVFNLYTPVLMTTLTRGPFDLTENMLRRAYCAVCFRHPILRARRDSARHRGVLAIPPHEQCVAMEQSDVLPVFVYRRASRESVWGPLMEQYSSAPWASSHFFQVDAYLLDDEVEREINCVLALRFNHAAGDGLALTAVLGDFVKVLNGCGDDGSLPPVDCLGEPTIIAKLLLERYPDCAMSDKDAVTEEERARMVDACLENLRANEKRIRHHIHDERLTEEQSLRFIRACKGHGVTVTAAVYAAMAIACDAREVRGGMPVSLRTGAERGEVSTRVRAMPVLVENLDPKAIEGADLWSLAPRFNAAIAEIRAKTSAQYTVRSMQALEIAMAVPDASAAQQGMYAMGAEAASRKRMSLFLSNVGVLDSLVGDREGHWRVEDYVPFVANAYTLAVEGVWAATLNNCIHLSFLSCEPPHGKQAFVAFASKTVEAQRPQLLALTVALAHPEPRALAQVRKPRRRLSPAISRPLPRKDAAAKPAPASAADPKAKRASRSASRSRSRSASSRSRSRSASKGAQEEHKVLLVTKLTRNVRQEHLNEIFAEYGKLKNVEFGFDRAVGLPKGFARLEYESVEDAEKAIRFMDGGQIDGVEVKVEWVVPINSSLAPSPDCGRALAVVRVREQRQEGTVAVPRQGRQGLLEEGQQVEVQVAVKVALALEVCSAQGEQEPVAASAPPEVEVEVQVGLAVEVAAEAAEAESGRPEPREGEVEVAQEQEQEPVVEELVAQLEVVVFVVVLVCLVPLPVVCLPPTTPRVD
eukprot:m51a1_g11746 putative arginine serine-rich protein 45-like (779) ;mRNA; r:160533-163479